jgi:hypothetical protein
MKSIVLAFLLAFTGFVARASSAEKPLHEQIDEAIKKGVAFLKTCQKDDGSFGLVDGDRFYEGKAGDPYHMEPGLTAFALYALLKSGVKGDDPVIQEGFRYVLGKSQPDGNPDQPKHTWTVPLMSYEFSTMILAVEALHNPHKKESIRVTLDKAKAAKRRKRLRKPKPVGLPAHWKERMQDWVNRLIARRSPHAWRYNQNAGKPGHLSFSQDMSSTQLALLALRAASHCHGIKFDRDILYDVIEYCFAHQDAEGPKYEIPLDPMEAKKRPGGSIQVISGMVRGFAYSRKSHERNEKSSTGSMTTAGCANLIICKELLHREGRYRREYEVKVNQAIRDSMMWIDKYWNMKNNPKSNRYFYYYLYGLERVGDLLGTLKIGNHYWYNEGAEVLVEEQYDDGAWERKTGLRPWDVIGTCFALLFLDRATPPIQVSGR